MESGLSMDKGTAVIKINPKLYNLEMVYSAAYVFLDKAYIVLDGDPQTEIIIRLKPKCKEDPERLGNEFFNELINYGDYQRRAAQTKEIRQMLLQRALVTNDSSVLQDNNSKIDAMDEDDDYLDDPEGIAIPWEEKYGNKKSIKDKNAGKAK